MSSMTEGFYRGRVGQECRRILAIVDDPVRIYSYADIRPHLSALSNALRLSDIPPATAGDLARALDLTYSSHSVPPAALAVLRRAAELF